MVRGLLVLLLGLVVAGPLRADDAALLQIQSLYAADGWVPGQLLPLRVTGSVPETGRFRGAHITSDGGQDCRVMRDPFRREIFLLKCARPERLTIEFAFELDGNVYRRAIGPIEVKSPDPNFVVETPTTPTPGLTGQQLFSSHCVSCHNPPASKARRNAAAIANAIQTNSQMRAIPSLAELTPAELSAIAQYLGGL